MDNDSWIDVIVIYIITAFFAVIGWVNRRVKNEGYVEGKTTTRTKIEGFTHSMISSLIAVVIFAGIVHFYPDWGRLLQGSIAIVCGALLSEAIIKLAQKRLNDDNILR